MSSKSLKYQKLIRLKVKMKRLAKRINSLTRQLDGYKGWWGNCSRTRKRVSS